MIKIKSTISPFAFEGAKPSKLKREARDGSGSDCRRHLVFLGQDTEVSDLGYIGTIRLRPGK